MKSTKITAEELFLQKYGNKITASDSWVIRFAEEYNSLSSLSEPVKQEPDGWIVDGQFYKNSDKHIKNYCEERDFKPVYFSPKEQKGKEITENELGMLFANHYRDMLNKHSGDDRNITLEYVNKLRTLLSSPSQQTEIKDEEIGKVLLKHYYSDIPMHHNSNLLNELRTLFSSSSQQSEKSEYCNCGNDEVCGICFKAKGYNVNNGTLQKNETDSQQTNSLK